MVVAKEPLNVVIIGGSLGGLMCGIALKQSGHDVTIIEKEDNVRESHMAGVCLGRDAVNHLALHDRLAQAFSHRSLRIQRLNNDSSTRILVKGRREITNWDTYYFRLRALFDGYVSSYYPSPPEPWDSMDGSALYSCRKEVRGLSSSQASRRDENSTGRSRPGMVLTVLDRETQTESEVEADIVVGADGPDSFIRSQYLPDCERRFVGYITWRGTVPESEVSTETRQIFRHSVNIHMIKGGGQHCVVYMIPGEDGSLEEGERYLNFVWYTSETDESLDEILKDGVDGHRHHNIVPAGRVRKDLWDRRLEEARRIPLPKPLQEIISKIQRPFIQVITDFLSPQAAFEDGKVLLMGDALSLFRPHTALSGTQGAFDALQIEKYLNGSLSLEELEYKVTRFARLHRTQSAWYGQFFQQHFGAALLTACRYWWYCAIDWVRSRWHGEEPLLITSVVKTETYADE